MPAAFTGLANLSPLLPFADADTEPPLGATAELGRMGLHLLTHTQLLGDLLDRSTAELRCSNTRHVKVGYSQIDTFDDQRSRIKVGSVIGLFDTFK